jgi:hypothetical protein
MPALCKASKTSLKRDNAINVSKSTAMLFASVRDASTSQDQSSLSENQYSGSKHHGILGVTLDTRLTLTAYVNQVERKAAQGLGVLGSSLTGKVVCPPETVCYFVRNSSVLWWIMHTACAAAHYHVQKLQVLKCKCHRIATTHLGASVRGKFTSIWRFHFSPTTSE